MSFSVLFKAHILKKKFKVQLNKFKYYVWKKNVSENQGFTRYSPYFYQGVKKPRCPHLGSWPRDTLFDWLRVSRLGACLDRSRGIRSQDTQKRTPRSYSPSLSSVCVLSWSCVFLCSFYVSLFAEPLFAEPQVSDEHLKYTCNIHVNYKGKYKG